MKLCDLYPKLSVAEREQLAKDAGINAGYLYQLATRWRGKRASLEVIKSLNAADRRLAVKDLVAEFMEDAGAEAPPAEQGA